MEDLSKLKNEYDRSNYFELLLDFPNQVQQGVQKGKKLDFKAEAINKIMVCGMGGSGIAGDLLDSFLFYKSSIPISTHRFYRVPNWVDSNTLSVIISYSGNTEETLSACEDALRCDSECLVVTSNGELENIAKDENLKILSVPDDLPPRAAVAYLFLPLPFILEDIVGFDSPSADDIERICQHLNDLADELDARNSSSQALEIAKNLKDRLPIIYGSQEVTTALSLRFKNQINENAKMFAVQNVVPEMNHNEIMGIDQLQQHPDRYGVVFLRDNGEHGRVQKRFEILRDLLTDKVGYIEEIESRGRTLLSRFLTIMLYTDFVSYYLALLNHKDPTSIGYINELKDRL